MTGTNSKQLKPVERVGSRMEGREGLSLLRHSKTWHERAVSAPVFSLHCSAFFSPEVFCTDLERWAFLVYVVPQLWSESQEKMLSSPIILLDSRQCGDP